MNKKIATIALAISAALLINIVGTGEYVANKIDSEKTVIKNERVEKSLDEDTNIAVPVAKVNDININDEIKSFIKNNPKLILDTINSYYAEQEKEKARLASLSAKDIENQYERNHLVPTFGDPTSDNTIVILSDYNCGYCKQLGNEVESLLATNKDVKIIISELPILSAKSQYFAKVAQAVWLTYPAKYEAFHAELLKINNNDENALGGIFNRLDIEFAAVQSQFENAENQIKNNHQLAQQLQIDGTPALIVNGQLIKGYIDKNKINSLLQG